MQTTPKTLLLSGLLLVAAAPAVRAESPTLPAEDRPRPEGLVRPRPVSPLRQQVADFVADLAVRRAALEEDFRRAGTAAEAEEIQAAIVALKRREERGVLEIQLRHAEAAGRTDQADQLRAALAGLEPTGREPVAGPDGPPTVDALDGER